MSPVESAEKRRWISDLPIRQKLVIVTLLASGVAALLAALAVLVYETTTFRPRVLAKVTTLSETLRLIMPAALDFDDPAAADENLRILSTIPEITIACVYALTGPVFARYPDESADCPPVERTAGQRFEGGFLKLFRSIDKDSGSVVGHLYLEYRLPPLLARLPQYGIMLAVVLVALVAVSILVSSSTQRLIAAPIWELASTALRVTATKDYGARAHVRHRDEIGALTDALNEMLDTIEENVAERRRAEESLRQHSQLLEERVEERSRELRAAQDQLLRQERLAFLGQLAGGVGHELRRPLATIGNAIYYLEIIHGDADEKTRQHIEIIRAQINNMEKIIHDLLDSLRVRPQELAEVELGLWLRDVLGRLEPPVGIEVVTEVPAEVPAVWMDSSQIEQVVTNLVTNAYQAMSAAGSLHVFADACADGVSLSFRDTGCGISEEHLASVFEPLFTTKSRGIGLGLTISKNFVEASGGRLSAQSVEGEGSTFTIFLPTRPPAHRDAEGPD